MRPEPDVGAWLRLTEALIAREALVSPLGAGLLAAVALGIAGDSRSFARDFETAHALVLRETTELSEILGLLAVARRDARTQRSFLTLTPAGEAAVRRAQSEPAPPDGRS